jgi:DNA-binding SARP family transcriptional activator
LGGVPLEDIPSAALYRFDGARLEEMRLNIVSIRVDAELYLGREQYLVAELRRLADEHPLREHVQAHLMLAHYRCGRQAEALAVYRKVRTSLIDELGIEPGARTARTAPAHAGRRSHTERSVARADHRPTPQALSFGQGELPQMNCVSTSS